MDHWNGSNTNIRSFAQPLVVLSSQDLIMVTTRKSSESYMGLRKNPPFQGKKKVMKVKVLIWDFSFRCKNDKIVYKSQYPLARILFLGLNELPGSTRCTGIENKARGVFGYQDYQLTFKICFCELLRCDNSVLVKLRLVHLPRQ